MITTTVKPECNKHGFSQFYRYTVHDKFVTRFNANAILLTSDLYLRYRIEDLITPHY